MQKLGPINSKHDFTKQHESLIFNLTAEDGEIGEKKTFDQALRIINFHKY